MIYTMAKRDGVQPAHGSAGSCHLLACSLSRRTGPTRRGRVLRTVYQVLARGGVVLMFPEGRYSRGRALRPLKVGIGHFALQAGVPICPVAVRWTDVLRPFSRVDVSIGAAIHPDPPAWWSLSQRVGQVVETVSGPSPGTAARAEAQGCWHPAGDPEVLKR
jgi:hypothetical protein